MHKASLLLLLGFFVIVPLEVKALEVKSNYDYDDYEQSKLQKEANAVFVKENNRGNSAISTTGTIEQITSTSDSFLNSEVLPEEQPLDDTKMSPELSSEQYQRTEELLEKLEQTHPELTQQIVDKKLSFDPFSQGHQLREKIAPYYKNVTEYPTSEKANQVLNDAKELHALVQGINYKRDSRGNIIPMTKEEIAQLQEIETIEKEYNKYRELVTKIRKKNPALAQRIKEEPLENFQEIETKVNQYFQEPGLIENSSLALKDLCCMALAKKLEIHEEKEAQIANVLTWKEVEPPFSMLEKLQDTQIEGKRLLFLSLASESLLTPSFFDPKEKKKQLQYHYHTLIKELKNVNLKLSLYIENEPCPSILEESNIIKITQLIEILELAPEGKDKLLSTCLRAIGVRINLELLDATTSYRTEFLKSLEQPNLQAVSSQLDKEVIQTLNRNLELLDLNITALELLTNEKVQNLSSPNFINILKRTLEQINSLNNKEPFNLEKTEELLISKNCFLDQRLSRTDLREILVNQVIHLRNTIESPIKINETLAIYCRNLSAYYLFQYLRELFTNEHHVKTLQAELFFNIFLFYNRACLFIEQATSLSSKDTILSRTSKELYQIAAEVSIQGAKEALKASPTQQPYLLERIKELPEGDPKKLLFPKEKAYLLKNASIHYFLASNSFNNRESRSIWKACMLSIAGDLYLKASAALDMARDLENSGKQNATANAEEVYRASGLYFQAAEATSEEVYRAYKPSSQPVFQAAKPTSDMVEHPNQDKRIKQIQIYAEEATRIIQEHIDESQRAFFDKKNFVNPHFDEDFQEWLIVDLNQMINNNYLLILRMILDG